ncbi:MAG: hypothetical protein ACR2FN_09190 [Chitinophagaceae bacterium]
MKRFFLALILALFITISQAQDFKPVETAVVLKQPEAAKTALDKVMTNPKAEQKPEAWYYKAWVYSSFYKDPALRAKYPNSETTADEAIKKYMQMDTSYALIKQYGADPLFNIYATSFNDGIRTFNTKNWDSASYYFGLAADYSDIIFKNKWSASSATIDTTSVQYAGYAFQNANKPDLAIKYYTKLADNKIGGKDFVDIYKFILDYYSKNKDQNNFQKYLAEAKQLYPDQSAVWNQFEMQNMTQNANLEDILAKYKQNDAGGKLTEDQYIGYAETFAGINKTQQSQLDSAKQVEIKFAAADAYKKAFALKNNGIYAYNAGVMYYSVYSSLDDRFYALKGTSADLKAQRAVVEKQEYEMADSALKWLETAYTILKAKTNRDKSESNSLNKDVDFLANIYLWKRDKSRGVTPADYDKYDAKFKQYDAEHGKYVQQ